MKRQWVEAGGLVYELVYTRSVLEPLENNDGPI